MEKCGCEREENNAVVFPSKIHNRLLLQIDLKVNKTPVYFCFSIAWLVNNNPNPPIKRSRARITRVTPIAEAAETPNAPSANTSEASSAPKPAGNGASSESQPAVHAATVCQNGKLIFRKLVISANSLTMPIPAQIDMAMANNNDERCRRQNVPANRSEAATKRTGFESLLRNG